MKPETLFQKIKRQFRDWLKYGLLGYCDHDWELNKEIRDYYDYSGNHVTVYDCTCKKCGIHSIEEFFGGRP